MDKKQLSELIKTGEGYALELKESLSSSLGKEMCAFANASGGKIVLGVKDDGSIKGFIVSNHDKSKIQDIARNMNPPFRVDIEQIDNLVVINIPDGANKPYSINGHFFLRIGSNSQQLNRDEIKEFFQDEGLIPFDEKLNKEFNINKDFNKPAYTNFLKRSKIHADLSATKLLANIGFIKNSMMTNAGVLFFCKDISKFFLNSRIICVLFQGTNKSIILDKQEFNFDLIINYDKAIEYLKSKLNTEFYIKTYRKEFLELPENALREAILNALAHRDYFSPAHTQINIFNDRMEIINPASFPSKITLADLLSGSHPKNRFLFSMMQRADLAEEANSGIGRIKSEMKAYKLDPPKFEYTGVWFIVTFNRPDLQVNSYQKRMGLEVTVKDTVKDTVKLNKSQLKIIKIISRDPGITIEELSAKIHITARNTKKNISKLKELGKLKRTGSDKAGHWEIIEK